MRWRKRGSWLAMGGLLLFFGAIWLGRELREQRNPAGGAPPAQPTVPFEIVSTSSTPSIRAASPAESLAPPAPEPPHDPRLDWLRGTVVDASGSPIQGATVVALLAPSADNTMLWQLDPEFRAALEPAAEAETGADGRFGFVLARGIPFDLEVSAPGRSTGFAPLCYAGQDVMVTLSAEHSVHGRLTRARDGGPIAGALARVIDYPSYATRASTSASDGSYRVSFPFEGAYLEVLPREEEASQWLWIELGPDGTAQMDFVLPDGVAVVGRVTEAGSGRPLAGAVVGEGWQFRRSAVTDAEGRYRLAGIGGAGAHGLAAKARGHGMAKRMELPSVLDGELHVDFELPPAWTASGRVVDRGGAPVEDALVVASGSFHGKDGQGFERCECRTDVEGRFRLEQLTPGSRQWLTVSASGFAQLSRALPEPAAGTESLLGELALAPPVLVAGRVLGTSGQALADAEVRIQGENGWRLAFTDALGRFAFGDLAPGRYSLEAKWNERVAAPRLELVLVDQEIREGLELRIQRGETLSGRVVDDRGGGIRGVNVTAELSEVLDPAEKPEESLYFYATSGENGGFRFEDILAGEYFIRAFPRGPTFADTAWMDGHARSTTGSAPVEIVLVKGDTIRGRVVDSSGAPLVNFSVTGHGASGNRTLISGTDALGRFELWVEHGTTWNLVVTGPLQGADAKELLVERDIAAGTQGLELALPRR